ncbi:hypothetical protein G6F22_019185 [Rhizopus arrhizus]|nr:hypothetical protein G6F22_019185 [Rhizopus arrhizus]
MRRRGAVGQSHFILEPHRLHAALWPGQGAFHRRRGRHRFLLCGQRRWRHLRGGGAKPAGARVAGQGLACRGRPVAGHVPGGAAARPPGHRDARVECTGHRAVGPERQDGRPAAAQVPGRGRTGNRTRLCQRRLLPGRQDAAASGRRNGQLCGQGLRGGQDEDRPLVAARRRSALEGGARGRRPGRRTDDGLQ